jgi:hypothetical protein
MARLDGVQYFFEGSNVDHYRFGNPEVGRPIGNTFVDYVPQLSTPREWFFDNHQRQIAVVYTGEISRNLEPTI